MLKYFIKRILSLIPKLILISIIIFLGLQLIPGDALSRTIPPEMYADMDPQMLEDLRDSLGLNDNLVIQYFRWIGNILKGDFGYSLVNGSSIAQMLVNRLPATMILAAASLLLATVFGLVLGFISAVRQNSLIDYTNAVFGMIGISVPPFFIGLGSILIFAIGLRWFPTGGMLEYGREGLLDRLHFLVLPSVCLGISFIATLMRFTRSTMLDVLNKEYIKTARSKGLSEVEVNFKHGFRNAVIPVMVILVFRIPMLVSGTVVIENVFNYPGMGSLLMSAISGADMPVVMISTLIISAVILLASFLVDIVTAMLDPRIRFTD